MLLLVWCASFRYSWSPNTRDRDVCQRRAPTLLTQRPPTTDTQHYPDPPRSPHDPDNQKTMATTSTAGLSHTLPPLSHLDFLPAQPRTTTATAPELDVIVTETAKDQHDRDASRTPDSLTIPDAMSVLASPIVPDSQMRNPFPGSPIASSSMVAHSAKRIASGSYKQPDGLDAAGNPLERKHIGQVRQYQLRELQTPWWWGNSGFSI